MMEREGGFVDACLPSCLEIVFSVNSLPFWTLHHLLTVTRSVRNLELRYSGGSRNSTGVC